MSTALSQSAEQNLQLLRALYHVNITVIREERDLEDFSERFRFHPLQHMLSPGPLRQLLQGLGENQVYLLTDAFMVRLALFTLHGLPVILGPFTSVLLSTRDVRILLERFPIPENTGSELLHYVNAFPNLPETLTTHIISSLLSVLCPEEATREIVNINYLEKPELEPEEKRAGRREDHTRLLERRYASEQAFIQSILNGNGRDAIHHLHAMQLDVAYLKRIGTTLENERIGAAIVRTTARLTAFHAGIPSVIVDRISSENTVSCFRAKTVDEIIRAQEKMVRDLCRIVQANRANAHSALVQSAVYSIQKDYAEELSVQSLADELAVSVDYLIKTFKKEMDTTPNAYLRDYRLKQAARLLSSTDRSVQEIASAVGIPDANYLIKLFKARYGETPTAYRKKYRV